MDSGRDTLTTVSTTVPSGNIHTSHNKPLRVFPYQSRAGRPDALLTNVSEKDDAYGAQCSWHTMDTVSSHSSTGGSYTNFGGPKQRHPPSPPVRLRDR